eukprot:TRINITY_DN66122_c13_g4_i1.p1 TRINITY_DN66122_c13_g4~~TRINITY_DN66122_c13_g4_i1.p1  ORF type:complete len:543 (-),score=66.52 TRINITY_DN66122_c13_g4_i1:1007-2635(-)
MRGRGRGRGRTRPIGGRGGLSGHSIGEELDILIPEWPHLDSRFEADRSQWAQKKRTIDSDRDTMKSNLHSYLMSSTLAHDIELDHPTSKPLWQGHIGKLERELEQMCDDFTEIQNKVDKEWHELLASREKDSSSKKTEQPQKEEPNVEPHSPASPPSGSATSIFKRLPPKPQLPTALQGLDEHGTLRGETGEKIAKVTAAVRVWERSKRKLEEKESAVESIHEEVLKLVPKATPTCSIEELTELMLTYEVTMQGNEVKPEQLNNTMKPMKEAVSKLSNMTQEIQQLKQIHKGDEEAVRTKAEVLPSIRLLYEELFHKLRYDFVLTSAWKACKAQCKLIDHLQTEFDKISYAWNELAKDKRKAAAQRKQQRVHEKLGLSGAPPSQQQAQDDPTKSLTEHEQERLTLQTKQRQIQAKLKLIEHITTTLNQALTNHTAKSASSSSSSPSSSPTAGEPPAGMCVLQRDDDDDKKKKKDKDKKKKPNPFSQWSLVFEQQVESLKLTVPHSQETTQELVTTLQEKLKPEVEEQAEALQKEIDLNAVWD